MPTSGPFDILVLGVRSLAHADDRGPALQALLGSIVEPLGIGSAAIFVVQRESDGLELVASAGIDDATATALAGAVRNPAHPIARTVTDRMASFDMRPTAPGGPALRSHLPLRVRRGGEDTLVGVLALAHDRPFDPPTRTLLGASADLAAVAIERWSGVS